MSVQRSGHFVLPRGPDVGRIRADLSCGRQGCECARASGNVHCPAHNDRTPSLGVSVNDGAVLVCCYAGCTQDAVIASLQERGVWPRPEDRVVPLRRKLRPVSPPPNVVSTTVYQIKDIAGIVQAEHVHDRLEDGTKSCRWQRPGNRSGLDGMKVATLPLYGMERLGAWPADAPIVLGEGEGVAEALVELGIPALGTVTGAGGTHADEVLRHLKDRVVICWADHDDEGRDHMRRHAEGLHRVGGTVRLLTWDGACEKGDDAADFIRRDGGTAEQIAEMITAAVTFNPNAERLAGMTIMTAGQIMALDIPDACHVIEGIVPEGLTLIGGKAKIGKSWLTLGESIAVAAGGKALGKIDVEPGEVLALAMEDTPRRLQGRLEAMLGSRRAPDGLHIATEWPRADQGGLEAIEAWLGLHPNTRLIVIDTWPKFRPPRGKHADPFQEDYEAAMSLKRIADAHPGLAIIVVIHMRKAPADDWVDTINATSGVSAAADAVSVIVRERGRADAVLKVTGRDIEERELALTWDPLISGWCYAGDAEEFRRSKERADILRVLGEADRPMAPREIVAALRGRNANTVRWLLVEMAKDGDIVKVGRGLYAIPNNANNPTSPTTQQGQQWPLLQEHGAARTPIVGSDSMATNNGLPGAGGAVVGIVGVVGTGDDLVCPLCGSAGRSGGRACDACMEAAR